jgi:hypothetical protein
MGGVLNDHHASWPWATPVIRAIPYDERVTFRVIASEILAGAYDAGVAGRQASATVAIDGGDAVDLEDGTRFDLGEPPVRHEVTVEIRTGGRNHAVVAFVDPDTFNASLE